MNLKEWASEVAETELQRAHDAGLGSERHYHYGQAAVLLFEAHEWGEAVKLLHRGLALQGRAGQRFVEGMRVVEAGVGAIRGYLRLAGEENAAAWQEGSADAE